MALGCVDRGIVCRCFSSGILGCGRPGLSLRLVAGEVSGCASGGLGAVFSGLGAVLCAMASNEYFSETVRIQKDRGHIVATNGP